MRKKSQFTLKHDSISNCRSIFLKTWPEASFLWKKPINSLISLKELEEKMQTKNRVKYCLKAPASTGSCDRLKKCWPQTIENCSSAICAIQHVLFQSEWPADFSQSLTDRLVAWQRRPQCFVCLRIERMTTSRSLVCCASCVKFSYKMVGHILLPFVVEDLFHSQISYTFFNSLLNITCFLLLKHYASL